MNKAFSYYNLLDEILVEFPDRIIAADYAKSFGEVIDIIKTTSLKKVTLDFSNTKYCNLFPISSLLLFLKMNEKQNQEILFILPEEKNLIGPNKMIRYFYNTGVLDYILDNFNIKYLDRVYLKGKLNIQEFNKDKEYYESAISKFKIIMLNQNEKTDKYVNEISSNIADYINKHYNSDVMNANIERCNNYLHESIENVRRHAYTEAFMPVVVCVTRISTASSQKPEEQNKTIESRYKKLQEQHPLSKRVSMGESYIGGIELYIQDYGMGIEKSYSQKSESLKLMAIDKKLKQIFWEGVPHEYRSDDETKTNGLKLVAKLISDHDDFIWGHDNRTWIGTDFQSQFGQYCKSDGGNESTTSYINGVTMRISLVLWKSNNGFIDVLKKRGKKLTIPVKDLIVAYNIIDFTPEMIVIDEVFCEKVLWSNIDTDILCLRAKNTFKNEILYTLKNYMSELSSKNKKIKKIILIDVSEISVLSIMSALNGSVILAGMESLEKIVIFSLLGFVFEVNISNKVMNYARPSSIDLSDQIKMYKKTIKHIKVYDSKFFSEILNDDYVLEGNINWMGRKLSHYIMFENIFLDTILRKLFSYQLQRIYYCLQGRYAVEISDDLLEDVFSKDTEKLDGHLVGDIRRLIIGSIVVTGKTLNKINTKNSDIIYLLKHPESDYDVSSQAIVLLDFEYTPKDNNEIRYERDGYSHRLIRSLSIDSNDKGFDKIFHEIGINDFISIGHNKNDAIHSYFNVDFNKIPLNQIISKYGLLKKQKKYLIDDLIFSRIKEQVPYTSGLYPINIGSHQLNRIKKDKSYKTLILKEVHDINTLWYLLNEIPKINEIFIFFTDVDLTLIENKNVSIHVIFKTRLNFTDKGNGCWICEGNEILSIYTKLLSDSYRNNIANLNEDDEYRDLIINAEKLIFSKIENSDDKLSNRLFNNHLNYLNCNNDQRFMLELFHFVRMYGLYTINQKNQKFIDLIILLIMAANDDERVNETKVEKYSGIMKMFLVLGCSLNFDDIWEMLNTLYYEEKTIIEYILDESFIEYYLNLYVAIVINEKRKHGSFYVECKANDLRNSVLISAESLFFRYKDLHSKIICNHDERHNNTLKRLIKKKNELNDLIRCVDEIYYVFSEINKYTDVNQSEEYKKIIENINEVYNEIKNSVSVKGIDENGYATFEDYSDYLELYINEISYKISINNNVPDATSESREELIYSLVDSNNHDLLQLNNNVKSDWSKNLDERMGLIPHLYLPMGKNTFEEVKYVINNAFHHNYQNENVIIKCFFQEGSLVIESLNRSEKPANEVHRSVVSKARASTRFLDYFDINTQYKDVYSDSEKLYLQTSISIKYLI